MGALEAFEKYCKQAGITSEQYIEEIRPVWNAAYRSALSTRLIKEVVEDDKEKRDG